MGTNVKRALQVAAVVGVSALFVALSVATPREGFNPLGELAGKLWHLALFLVFWFAVYALGRGVAKLLFGRGPRPPDLVAALGVAAAVVLAFGICAVGLAYGWLAKALVVIGAAAGVVLLRKDLARVPDRVKRWLAELETSSAILVVGTAALALPIALNAAVPPYYWDALTYHLAVPKAYADAHGFIYMPYNVYSSMPMGGSLFYLWPYLWDGLITAKASHLVATALALSLTYRLARIWLSQFYATLAASFVMLTSPVMVVIGGAHNDHFQILFVVAALYVYFKWGKRTEIETKRVWLALGIFVGAALAVKYSAYAVVAAFLPIWIYDAIRKRVRPSWLVKAIIVAFVMVLPWLVKAYVERGNPVFPLFYGFFDGPGFSAEQADRLMTWQLGMGRGRGILDLILLPYRVSVEADVSYKEFSGIYLPFLLPLATLATVFFRRGGRLVAYGWMYLLAWFFGPQQLRFLGAALPALAVAAAAVLAAAEGRWGGWPRRLWRSFVVIALFLVSIPYFAGAILSATSTYSYLFRPDRDEFLRTRVGFFAAQEFINKELPPDAKVLMVFTNHTLYLERAAAYDSFLEASALLLAAEKADNGAELYALAREWGCGYVHIYHSYEPKVWPYYTPRARDVFYDFVRRYGVVIYRDRLNGVYELVGGER
jgi:4-amino-4-deoxy-L-arabinose transferase-like glycosyltransferase